MVVQVQKVGEMFVIPAQVVRELGLSDGASVDIQSLETKHTVRATQYASTEEVLATYRRLEPEYREVFEELAK